MIRDYNARLVQAENISDGIIHQIFYCPDIAAQAQPGNFVLLKVTSGASTAPLLRRPLGILAADADAGTIEIAFRVVGTGTDLLASALTGQIFSVRGPVGGAFAPARHKNLWAVAGTLGVIPLLFLRSRLAKKENGFNRLLLGVPNAGWKNFADWVKSRAPELELYSDDGSLGEKGFVTNGLAGADLSDVSLVCCGPNPMMKALYKTYGTDTDDLRTRSDDIQVSLEKRMGCGMGGCFGCVVDTTSGLRRVCIDGPVFQAKDVIWDELHL